MFQDIFSIKKPIIGMIHLAGDSKSEKLKRALEELAIYERNGVDGAIIQDFHGAYNDVLRILEKSQNFNITRGINIIMDPYLAFGLAVSFKAQFIQFDSVQQQHLELERYDKQRTAYPNIAVLGGVRFKGAYTIERALKEEISDGRLRCDAIVTAGAGPGFNTPTEKLRYFKQCLKDYPLTNREGINKDFPLISGEGVNTENIYDQLAIADAAIIGRGFKPNRDSQAPISDELVKRTMECARKIREF